MPEIPDPDPSSELSEVSEVAPAVGTPITHVNVIPFDDQLMVTWRGGSDAVSVFVSDTVDDAGVRVWAPDRPGVAMVPRHESGRSFIHLFDPTSGFRLAAERRLPMDGPVNFRDLGGYSGLDGRQVRWGRVFRSDRLDSTSSVDRQRISDMGITTVFDLRAAAEVAEAADHLPDGVTHVHLAMSSDGVRARTMMERIAAGDLVSFTSEQMVDGYLLMLEVFPGHIARVIESVAAGETSVVHCTAGKDRTGITAMILLLICGVSDADILDDYELTNSFSVSRGEGFADTLRGHGLEPDDFATIWLAPRSVMKGTLLGFRDRWSDVAGYLRFAGVDDSTVSAFRREMLCDETVS